MRVTHLPSSLHLQLQHDRGAAEPSDRHTAPARAHPRAAAEREPHAPCRSTSLLPSARGKPRHGGCWVGRPAVGCWQWQRFHDAFIVQFERTWRVLLLALGCWAALRKGSELSKSWKNSSCPPGKVTPIPVLTCLSGRILQGVRGAGPGTRWWAGRRQPPPRAAALTHSRSAPQGWREGAVGTRCALPWPCPAGTHSHLWAGGPGSTAARLAWWDTMYRLGVWGPSPKEKAHLAQVISLKTTSHQGPGCVCKCLGCEWGKAGCAD